MRPRFSLYVRWLLPHTDDPYVPSRFTQWEHEGDFMLKRSAWKRAEMNARWHPSESKIRRFGEPI